MSNTKNKTVIKPNNKIKQKLTFKAITPLTAGGASLVGKTGWKLSNPNPGLGFKGSLDGFGKGDREEWPLVELRVLLRSNVALLG